MSLLVKLKDVIDALEIAGYENRQYLDRRTGEVIVLTKEEMSAAEEDEDPADYPDWQKESILIAQEVLETDHYLELPTQFDMLHCTSQSWRQLSRWHTDSWCPSFNSLRPLCVLGVSAVCEPVKRKFTAETPSTQRGRRDRFFCSLALPRFVQFRKKLP